MKLKTDVNWLERKLAVAIDEDVDTAGTCLEDLKRLIDRRSVTPATIAAAPTELGKVIRFVRERKGLTQDKLAEVAKIDKDEIVSLETKQDARPSPRALINIADALELSRSRMKVLAGFTTNAGESVCADYPFAAKSNRIDSVSEDEYESIRALVEVLSQK
jgi:transcriptional regulator with XRE-family HTH domain